MPLRRLVQKNAGDRNLDLYPLHFKNEQSGGYNYGNSVTPIFDGTFRQRSFKFGEGTANDRPFWDGDGFSREPFIGKNFELPDIDDNPSRFVDFTNTLTDGLIRGGIITAASRTAKDVARIAKFYISQRGIGFILKQVGLQRTNPVIRKMEVDTGGDALSTFQSIGEGIQNLGGSNSNQRVYNLGVNTLAQIAGSAFGLHIKREGLLPTAFEGYIDDIEASRENLYGGSDKEWENNGYGPQLLEADPLKGNRLINLFGSHILKNTMQQETEVQWDITGQATDIVTGQVAQATTPEALGTLGEQMGSFGKFLSGGNDLGKKELYSFSGGAGSLYGIGNTTIMKASTLFNTVGEVEMGGHKINLIDSSPWLHAKTGYIGVRDKFMRGSVNKGLDRGNPEIPHQIYIPKRHHIAVSEVAGSKLLHNYFIDNNTLGDPLISPYASIFTARTSKGLKGDDNFINDYWGVLNQSRNKDRGNADNATPRPIYDADKGQLNPENPEKLKLGLIGDNFAGRYAKAVSLDDVVDFRILKNLNTVANDLDHDHKSSNALARSNATDYKTRTSTGNVPFYRETRVGLGNPGQKMQGLRGKNTLGKSTDSYDLYVEDTIDKINALDIFKNDSNLHSFGQQGRDLIRFRIEALNGGDPTKSKVMVFRAFLDSFGDGYTGNWNSYKYNGRAEKFYTYDGFDRNINFSFKIAAQSRHEMMPLYRKLNYLVSQTAPEYNNRRMRGSFCRVTIGSMIDRVPGFFSNIKLNWNKNYPWEITINEAEGREDYDGILQMPHILDVSCTFKPIHTFAPQKSVHSPFILPTHSGLRTSQKWWKHKEANNYKEADLASQRKKQGFKENFTDATPIESPTTQNTIDDTIATQITLPSVGNEESEGIALNDIPTSNDYDEVS